MGENYPPAKTTKDNAVSAKRPPNNTPSLIHLQQTVLNMQEWWLVSGIFSIISLNFWHATEMQSAENMQ